MMTDREWKEVYTVGYNMGFDHCSAINPSKELAWRSISIMLGTLILGYIFMLVIFQ